MNLKVQLPGVMSVSSILNSGTDVNLDTDVFTFHAYSVEMKARVLELIARGQKVVVIPTDESPRDGEWFEKPHS